MRFVSPQQWFWLMLPLVTAHLEGTSYVNGYADMLHTDADSGIARRQIPTSSTFDFWWPFPAPTTTAPATPVGISIPFLISPAPTAAQSANVIPSSSIIIPFSGPTSGSPSTPRSSLPTSQASSSDAATSTAQSESPPIGTFKITSLIPAFVSVAVFLSALGIWVLYGCCTRKPRMRHDDGELVCGPPYANIDNEDGHRDVEERGAGQDMLEIPPYNGRRGRAGGQLLYRWPSFTEPPPFDPVKYHNGSDERKHDSDEDLLSTVTLLAAPPNPNTTRGRSQRSSKSTASLANPNANPHLEMSPQFSNATSAALYELYESDNEDAKERRANEAPWESLRHKSIRRGIIEQVKKENKWMDSIRGSLAAAAAQISGTGSRDREYGGHGGMGEGEDTGLLRRLGDEAPVATRSPRSPEEERGPSVGQRRRHRRNDSDVQIDDTLLPSTPTRPRRVALQDGGAYNPSAHTSNPMNTSASIDVFDGTPDRDPGPRSGVRRGYTWLRDREDEDKYTPRPTRATDGRSRSHSRSRSRSTSPVKARANGTQQDVPPRDILPRNPAQILSPPLESQICFTPVAMPAPPPIAVAPQSASRTSSTANAQVRPKTRARGATIDSSSTSGLSRIPMRSPTKSRSSSRPRYRKQASSASSVPVGSPPRPVPFPTSDYEGDRGVGRNQLVKKASSNSETPAQKCRATPQPPVSNGSMDALKAEVDREVQAQIRRQTTQKNAAEADALKRVELIMESSWSARDLHEEEMRCLSPSAFGRQP